MGATQPVAKGSSWFGHKFMALSGMAVALNPQFFYSIVLFF
jgi:hypothetical protein